jgi:hypothetical protein
MNNTMQTVMSSMRKPTGLWMLSLMIIGLSVTMGLKAWNDPETPGAAADAGSKSVAWYVANIHEARAMNRACFSQGNAASDDCRNSLQALNISHVSQNYQN